MHSGSPSPKAIEIFSLVTWLYELFSFPLVLKLDTKKQSQTKRTQAGGKSRECLRIPWIKGEGHSKKLTFLSSPIASKHSSFPLTEVSVSEGPAILKKFVSKEMTSEAANLAGSQAVIV